ncbi:MAG: tol-pal system protein YbgF [Pseudomonadota bacterium]
MRAIALFLVVTLGLTAPAVAQQDRDQTLADIRQEMSVLYVMIQQLKRELSTTAAPRLPVEGASFLERLDVIEGELQRLTARTEELENLIGRIVADGTNRIEDLEFRLIELEGGDLSQLSQGTTLGGAPLDGTPLEPQENDTEGEMAVGEQADFDVALAAFAEEDYAEAIRLLEALVITYPGGPLSVRAHVMRGDAHWELEETTEAARAYLDAFSGAPDGPNAPDALYKLGAALGKLGQTDQACVTLREVGLRFPGNEAASRADVSLAALNCP